MTCHNICNLGEHESDLNVDNRIVTDLVAACQAVADRVNAFIHFGRKRHSRRCVTPPTWVFA